MENYEKRKDACDSYPEGAEFLLKKTAKRNRTISEDADAPQHYDICQSERVWEFQNRDFWITPTDLSWHYPILVTIREVPFKSYRGRSSGKSKARETKIEKYNKCRSWSWQSYFSWQ